MSACPACRTPAPPGATRCPSCNAFLDGLPAGTPQIAATTFGAPAPPPGPPAGAYGAPPPAPGGYGGPPAPGGYGAPPAPGGYGAPPAPGGYGAPPAPGGYGGPPAPGGYGAPPAPGAYGAAPPGMGPPMGGPGMGIYGAPAPAMGFGGAPAFPPPRKAGMSGCGIAAIIGAVVAVLFGGLIVVGAIAASSSSEESDSGTPPPDQPTPFQDPDIPERDDVPTTGALNSLIKDRVGAYRLKGVGDVTNLGSALQGNIVDSKGAEYVAPDGSNVTVLMLVYATEGIAQQKINDVERIFRSEPGHVVVRSQVLNKQRRVVGSRIRVTGAHPQRVYWSNGKLLSFTTAPAPHAVGFEMAAPF